MRGLKIAARLLVPFAFGLALTILAQTTVTKASEIMTALPHLYDDWAVRVAGPGASDKDVRAAAERERPRVQRLLDPFTPLAKLSCDARRAKDERVVWEDDSLMVLVDKFDHRTKLLVTPKQSKNFPIDLSKAEINETSRVAAAACDALFVASGSQVTAGANNCNILINPPRGISLKQLHVHVVAPKTANMNDAFLQVAAQQMRRLLRGRGCF